MRYQQQHRPIFFVLLLPILLVLVQVLSATTSSVNALSLTRRSSSSSKIQTPTKLKRQYHKGRRTGGRSSSSSSQLTSKDNFLSSNDGVGATTDDGGGGTATVPEEIFNLIKSIIGAGVLSLPAGIAVLASSSSANTRNHRILLSSSFLLIAVMGTISAYTFSLIARVCHMTNTTTYADCWTATMKDHSNSKGDRRSGSSLFGSIGAFMVALASTLVC